jgi:hypothetical protein
MFTLDADTLAGLLRDAANAHHVYEQTTGKPDPDWAIWYASYIAGMYDDPGAWPVAQCPLCGQPVAESPKGFDDENRAVVTPYHWKPLPATVPLDAVSDTDIAAYGSAYLGGGF